MISSCKTGGRELSRRSVENNRSSLRDSGVEVALGDCAEIAHNGSCITYSRSALVARIITFHFYSAYLANQESDLV